MLLKNNLLNVISSPYLYLVLIAVGLIISLPSLSYINIGKILRSYFSEILFKHKLIKLFVFIPVLLAQVLNLVDMVDIDAVENISVSISIFISLFFAYMAFYDDYKLPKTYDASKTEIIKKTSKESQIIVSYEIFICVILLVLSMFYKLFYVNNKVFWQITSTCELSIFSIYSLIMYALFIHLILNLLVLLKRYDFLKDKDNRK